MGKEKKVETEETRIKKETARIKKLYKDLPVNRKNSLTKLIERAAFMVVSLESMETKIREEGQMVKMRQGEYEIDRAHPLLTTYNAMIKNYTATVKLLDEVFAETNGDQPAPGSKLAKFVNRSKEK